MTDERSTGSRTESSFTASHEYGEIHRPPVPGNRDVVDTDWDIPVIDFPSDTEVGAKRRIAGSGIGTNPIAGNSVGSRAHHSTVDLRDAITHNDHLLDPWDVADVQTSRSGDEFDEVIAGAVQADEERSDDNPNIPERHAAHHAVSHRAWGIVIICAALVIIALVAVGALRWHHDHELRMQSAQVCSTAVARYSTADRTLQTTLTEIAPQRKITAQQVSDGATVTRLDDATKKAQGLKLDSGQLRCGASLSAAENTAHANAANTASRTIGTSVGNLRTLASAVAASGQHYQAERSSAVNALTSTVTQAQQVLSVSRYQVTDNTTRIDLESAIGTAKQQLAQPDTTLDAIRKAEADVRTAQEAVTASMQAFNTQQQLAAQSYQQPMQQSSPRQQVPSTNVQPQSSGQQAPIGSQTGALAGTGQ